MACSWFEIEGYRFGIRTTSATFGEWLAEVLSEYGSAPRPEDDPSDCLYSVVVEDGSAGRERLGRRFSIIYQGGWDIVRTMDVPFLAEQLLNHVEGLRAPIRDDAIFLEAGLTIVDGRVGIIPAVLQPAVQRAKRRAERRGLVCPGGMGVAIDPETGLLLRASRQLRIPPDALERAAEVFPVTDSTGTWRAEEPTPISSVLFRIGEEQQDLQPMSRGGALVELAPSIRNVRTMGGAAFRGLARMLAGAACYGATWESTDEMLAVMRAAVAEAYVTNRMQDTLSAR